MSKTDFQNGFALGMASGGVVEVVDTTEIDALETLIDESGVLEGAEGTATEKVEQLIGKVVYEFKAFEYIVTANGLFYGVHKFPTKAIVNLPNVNTVYQAFSAWNTEPIPIVEELTVNAPKINVSSLQTCMGNMFYNNWGVKKVILKMPDECQHMQSTFTSANKMEEIVLNFSTKNITNYFNAFYGCTVKKIVGVLDFSSATNVGNMFWVCSRKVRPEPLGPNRRGSGRWRCR